MTHFPFSAVVGSDDLALALALTTVSPAVGGVLVRGEKGTAKSTMVRALAALLPEVTVVEGCRFACDPDVPDPDCPDAPHQGGRQLRPARLVELPVGATEDRVIGSLHLGRALGAGETTFDPGLLAAAHRGLLYVDEVNLLPDHLVDVLLDAAAMGRARVERDSVSVTHASSFVLVGTMNPEEGELRPQLLDRFGLGVDVAAPRDPATRTEVVRRRLAFEADPAGFARTWAADERALAERIVKSRSLLPAVVLGEDALASVARVCAGFEVDGMRGDLVTARTAVAHAAWCGRTHVTREDVRVAARLALPHRQRRSPFDEPGLDEDLLDELLGDEPPEDPDDPGGGGGGGEPEGTAPEGSGPEGGEPEGAGAGQTTVAAGSPYRTRLFTIAGTGAGEAGRRSRAITSRGRTVGATRTPTGSGRIHLVASLRAAALRRAGSGGSRRVTPADLWHRVEQGRESNLVLLCVDASGSMAARKRMEQVKAAVLSLLLDAYQRRDKVGLVTFGGDASTLVVPPTGSVELAARRLQDLPAGGRTPLAEGLARAADVLRVEGLRDPRRRPLLVVVTDGRATAGTDAVPRSLAAADLLRHRGVPALVVDCETGRFRMGLAADLARRLGAEHVAVGEVSASALTTTIRQTTRRRAA